MKSYPVDLNKKPKIIGIRLERLIFGFLFSFFLNPLLENINFYIHPMFIFIISIAFLFITRNKEFVIPNRSPLKRRFFDEENKSYR